MKPTTADIDALIDRVAQTQLRRAVSTAILCPSPENLAVLQGWPADWVEIAERELGVPRDRRHGNNVTYGEATAVDCGEEDGFPQALARQISGGENPKNPEMENRIGRANGGWWGKARTLFTRWMEARR